MGHTICLWFLFHNFYWFLIFNFHFFLEAFLNGFDIFYNFRKTVLSMFIAMIYMTRTFTLTDTIFVVRFFNYFLNNSSNFSCLYNSLNIFWIFFVNNFFSCYNFLFSMMQFSLKFF